MARPTKQGIDYFPLDCRFDDKIEMYLIEKGAVGLGVLITLWQMIYSNHGYYITNNNDLHLLIKRKIDVDANEVSECINTAIRRNLFDENLHEKYAILTSSAIQKRYFEAAKKKKTVSVCVDYVINGIASADNWVNVVENATNVKVNVKVKVKETKPEKPFVFPDWLNVKSWDEFEQHRRDIKKPMSDLARKMNLKVLAKHQDKQAMIINLTIANRWVGLFEPKGGFQGNKRTNFDDAHENLRQQAEGTDNKGID